MYIDFSLQQMYRDDCDEALAVSLPCQCVIFSSTVSSEYLLSKEKVLYRFLPPHSFTQLTKYFAMQRGLLLVDYSFNHKIF